MVSRNLLRVATCLLLLLGTLLSGAVPTLAQSSSNQSASQIGGKRIALVIGNAAYRSVEPLANATNDARLIAATLRKLNFTLVGGGAQTDLDRAHMANAVEQFGQLLAGADVGLFYYSGHGLQVAGVNWLVPIDANPTRPKDLDFQMIDADLVLRQMDGAGTRLNLVMLDACRNNPFNIGGARATKGGLAEMRAPEGTLIAYATQPGNVAQDGDGKDSPYTTALARTMQLPGLDIFRTFNQVGLEVKRATSGEQQPWVSNSPIDGDFYFASPPVAPPAIPPPAIPPPAIPPPAIPPAVAALPQAPAALPTLVQAAPTAVVQPPTAPTAVVPAPTPPTAVAQTPPGQTPQPTTSAAQTPTASAGQPSTAPLDPQQKLPEPIQVAGLSRPIMPGAFPPTATLDAAKSAVALARARQCAILDARQLGNRIDLQGFAIHGADWDEFMQQVGTASGLRAEAYGVDFLPPFACDPLEVFGPVLRAARETGSARLVSVAQRQLAASETLAVTLRDAAGKTITLDIYRRGDLVDHVKVQPTPSNGVLHVSIVQPANAPPGPRLLTALFTEAPLGLGNRPATEPAKAYLAALRQALRNAGTGARADLTAFELKPAILRTSASAAAPATSGSHCGGIMERAQLGEALTDADRNYLKTQCH